MPPTIKSHLQLQDTTHFYTLSMSSATISAIAVFENPRRADKGPKMLMFDAQIYLEGGRPPIVAILRYFNSHDQAFEDVGVYSIISTVCINYLLAVSNISHSTWHRLLKWRKGSTPAQRGLTL
jgi:hypothetical protein